MDEEDVRVGDRVRMREDYDRVGTVTSVITESDTGRAVEATVQWFGYDYPDMLPTQQLEVLARYDD